MNYEFYENMNQMDNMKPFNMIEDINMYTMNNYSPNLFNPYEGYLKGNAFKDEYMPYKDYKVAKININSEKEEMMINIGEYSFMMHDLNLYLDVHPNDREALKVFMEYRQKVNELITNYERKYGPITTSGIKNNVPFEWVTSNWPWVK